MEMLLALINTVVSWLILVELFVSWPVTDNLGRLRPGAREANTRAYRVYMALLPFTWVMWIYCGVHLLFTSHNAWDVFMSVLYIAIAGWWYFQWKNNRDDRWKKRRAKLASQVKVAASGKLTVVPAKA
jgi:hypothetical protein